MVTARTADTCRRLRLPRFRVRRQFRAPRFRRSRRISFRHSAGRTGCCEFDADTTAAASAARRRKTRDVIARATVPARAAWIVLVASTEKAGAGEYGTRAALASSAAAIAVAREIGALPSVSALQCEWSNWKSGIGKPTAAAATTLAKCLAISSVGEANVPALPPEPSGRSITAGLTGIAAGGARAPTPLLLAPPAPPPAKAGVTVKTSQAAAARASGTTPCYCALNAMRTGRARDRASRVPRPTAQSPTSPPTSMRHAQHRSLRKAGRAVRTNLLQR